jgi:cyanophycin synthetase
VVLRNNANLSTGGTATDVTDEVHPELAARAIEAAQTIGLDICGVDVVCETVLKPLEEQNGRHRRSQRRARPAHAPRAVLRQGPRRSAKRSSTLFGRVTTPHSGHGRGRHQWQDHHGAPDRTPDDPAGLRVGMTNTDGVYVGGEIDTGDCSGPRSARNVLAHPDVDAAVLETARGGVLREGLGFDRCQIAVVTNIGKRRPSRPAYITTWKTCSAQARHRAERGARPAWRC